MSESISTTLIGNQSWMVQAGASSVLVDPMLSESFGHGTRRRFVIDPPRHVDMEKMPRVSGIVITNEHLDHFHVPSIVAATRRDDCSVFLSSLMPQPCIDVLQREGVDVRVVDPGTSTRVEDFEVTFFPSPPDVPLWESRVCSVFLSLPNEPSGVFVQSDTALLDRDDYGSIAPDVFIATHNAQISKDGSAGAFDNLLPIDGPEVTESLGIELLHATINQPLDLFPSVNMVLLSGSGYCRVPGPTSGFMWTEPDVLETAGAGLSIGPRLVGLRPGQRVESGIKSDSQWIVRLPRDETLQKASDSATGATAVVRTDDAEEELKLIDDELAAIAPLLMLSPVGRAAINVNKYPKNPLGPLRFVVHVTNDDGSADAWYLNLRTARFEHRRDVSLREAVLNVPFGVTTNRSDLADVLRGKLHIWELAVSGLRQWYVGPKYESPVAVLYGLWSEQLRPDLAMSLFDGLLRDYG